MDKIYHIIALNPGSTSTKVAAFENDKKLFSITVEHQAEELSKYKNIIDQLPYRRETILQTLKDHNVDLSKTDAFVGRGGGLPPMPGGVYNVSDIMYDHASRGLGSRHPSMLGPMLARDFAREFHTLCFVVNATSSDEFWIMSRMTGLKEIVRSSRTHALNQKEVAMRYAAEIGRRYEDLNLVVSHMGGGISVTAHRKGKMVDSADTTNGEGRMAPTRTGGLVAADLVRLCFSGKYTQNQLMDKIAKTGGWVDHLGTSDGREVEKRIGQGDLYARLVFETTAYQVGKDIGMYAAVLSGDVDAIILTGGLAHSKYFTGIISEMTSFIAPVKIYPGEFEMEALAAGAMRALNGEEKVLEYTGEPPFKGFDNLTEKDFYAFKGERPFRV